VIFPDRSGGSLGAPVYDFMGYCGQNGNYDPDKWISVRGWNDTLRALATGYPGSQSSFQASVRSLLMKPSTGQQLIVTLYIVTLATFPSPKSHPAMPRSRSCSRSQIIDY
jgi:hypothetical protein